MRNVIILFALSLTAMTLENCGESSPVYRDSKGRIYLNRIHRLNQSEHNDCTLDRCDERRLDRWRFDEVYAQVINDSTIHIHVGIDGLFVLMNCQNKLSQYATFEEVILTGIGRDACGVYEQSFCCDIGLFLDIHNIRRF